MKKETENKFILKQFKDKSSFWWLNNKVYHLNEKNSVVFICGGKEDLEEIKYLEEFCKRNKKRYCKRELSIFEQEQKEYLIISYGKYNGKPLNEIVEIDKRYARWIYDNSIDKNIKEQLKDLLKIK